MAAPDGEVLAARVSLGSGTNGRRRRLGSSVQDRYVVTARARCDRADHQFSESSRRWHDTVFGEVAVRGSLSKRARGRH
jgi:hypothetical protein